jgi:hypothetical protein
MIDEHIILIEFIFNSFNTTCGFNKKTRSSKKIYWWIEMFEMNDIMVNETQDKHQVEQPFVEHWKKRHTTFELLYLHLYYLWYIFAWYIVVMMLLIYLFFTYDVQYVVVVYGFKINWIFVFTNH